MSTIQENLQTIADSTAAIKQAIIDKGGEITGDITTWANAINGISGGESSGGSTPIILRGSRSASMTVITYEGTLHNLQELDDSVSCNLVATYFSMGTLHNGHTSFKPAEGLGISVSVDIDEPVFGSATTGLFIHTGGFEQSIYPVIFEEV